MTLNLGLASKRWRWPRLDSSLWLAQSEWEVIMVVHVNSRVLDSGTSTRSTGPPLPPPQPPCLLSRTSATSKVVPSVADHLKANHPRNVWYAGLCAMAWVCFFCSSLGKGILNYFVWRHKHRAEDPRGVEISGRERDSLASIPAPGAGGAVVYLVVFAQALAFPSGPPVEVKL